MSEEKLDLIQEQLHQLLQGMNVMQQGMNVMQQDVSAMKQNDNALREDINDLRNRINNIEGAVMLIVRDGFTPLRNYADDLNFEVSDSDVQRKNRLLNRRVRCLERRDSNDDFEY